jgi:hypothetical protein
MTKGFVPLDPERPDRHGWIADANGCHIWTGRRSHSGYAMGHYKGVKGFVYRIRYEREVGPVPEGMDLDHYVCDNGPGGCCNPLHCRPATHRDNIRRSQSPPGINARKTHCPNGHELSGDNLDQAELRSQGSRKCRMCKNAGARSRRAARPRRPGMRVRLSNDQIREILRRLDDGETQSALGREFGVGQTAISRVKLRTTTTATLEAECR